MKIFNYKMQVRGSFLVILASSLFPITLAITYTLAVCSNHVYPFVPFMSYTGDLPIESCIFSVGANLTAVFYFMVIYLRYIQMDKMLESDTSLDADVTKRKNVTALQWGTVSSLGLSMTGSFQQANAYSIHLMGAALCSYCGFAYFCYQTVLSRKLVGKIHGTNMLYFRAALCLSNATFLLSAPVLLLYIDLFYSRSHAETVCWNFNEDGWPVHLCSSILEWLMFCANEAYIVSFYKEFKDILIHKDEIIIDRK